MKTKLYMAALLICAACQNSTTGTDTVTEDTVAKDGTVVEQTVPYADTVHTAETALDIAGTYKGTLPCADCPGIEVTLVLNNDKTYKQTLKYLERKTDFAEEGTWEVKGNTLTTTKGKDVTIYKAEENRLVQLDKQGHKIEGPHADNYILKKQ